MTAGLGAAIAAGQGVANASTDEGSGTDSGATSYRGPERTEAERDKSDSSTTESGSSGVGTSSSIEHASRNDEPTEQDDGQRDEGEIDAEPVDIGSAKPDVIDDDVTATPATQPAVTVEVLEEVPAETDLGQLPGGDSGPGEPPPVATEALLLSVRDQQQWRNVEKVAEIPTTSEPAPRPADWTLDTAGGPARASLAMTSAGPLANAALAPPNWFATALNNASVFARNVTNAVVETTRRVIDGIVRVTVSVVDGVARILFGDYDSIPVQTPTDTRGHWERLRTVTGGLLNDGFHIDKVRSAHDGEERLTVYIGGTTFGLNQPVFQNSVGWTGQAQYWQVEQIKRAQGDDPDIEILIFGYSQGGMDAQNLAAHAAEKGLNVAMVLTFGSPVIQDPPDDPYAWIFHIQANKDPVPDWGQPGKRDTARAAGIVFDTTTRTGNKFWADWNGLGEVHGDPATYREAAEKFDDWLSDSNMDYWEGQYIRSY